MVAEGSEVLVTGPSLPPLKPGVIKLLLTVALDCWKLLPGFQMRLPMVGLELFCHTVCSLYIYIFISCILELL